MKLGKRGRLVKLPVGEKRNFLGFAQMRKSASNRAIRRAQSAILAETIIAAVDIRSRASGRAETRFGRRQVSVLPLRLGAV
jgi:hypothetical protein